MAPGENRSSAMDLETGSDSSHKDQLISSKESAVNKTDEFDEEPDESLSERLWGLTEMFPESVRDATYSMSVLTTQGVKSFYNLSRNVVWILVSSSVILFAPLIFEVERAQMEDMQRTQQKQVLLGPNTAVSGHGVPMPPMR